jgi:hypothetical protein
MLQEHSPVNLQVQKTNLTINIANSIAVISSGHTLKSSGHKFYKLKKSPRNPPVKGLSICAHGCPRKCQSSMLVSPREKRLEPHQGLIVANFLFISGTHKTTPSHAQNHTHHMTTPIRKDNK